MAKDKINIKPLKPTGKENKDMNLSTPMVVKKKSPNKKSKPSNRKLDGEKFLDKPKHKVAKNAKMPSKKRLDGENFLGGKYIKTFNQVNLAPGLQGKEMTVGSIKEELGGDPNICRTAVSDGHWSKFSSWLSEKDFELFDGEEDLHNRFLYVANDDNLSSEEKAHEITGYMDAKWGVYDGYDVIVDYLDSLFMDEISESIKEVNLDKEICEFAEWCDGRFQYYPLKWNGVWKKIGDDNYPYQTTSTLLEEFRKKNNSVHDQGRSIKEASSWEISKRIEEILDRNIKEIKFEGTQVDKISLKDDLYSYIMELIGGKEDVTAGVSSVDPLSHPHPRRFV